MLEANKIISVCFMGFSVQLSVHWRGSILTLLSSRERNDKIKGPTLFH